MHRRSSEVIVLRTRPLREADLLLTLLTPAEGKLVGVAAHARRSQRRFGGALEVGTVGAVTFVERAHQDLVRIEEMHVTWSPLGQAVTSIDHHAARGLLLETVEATTVERQASEEKFACVKRWVMDLPQAPGPWLIGSLTQWFVVLGLAPALDQCGRCRVMVGPSEPLWFLPQEGSGLCAGCAERSYPRSAPCVVLDGTDRLQWARSAAGDVAIHCSAGFRDAAWGYCRQIVGRPLRSENYWSILWHRNSQYNGGTADCSSSPVASRC